MRIPDKIVSFIMIICLISFSCDILTTRDAELPEQPRSNFQQAFTPDILIENFINALSDKNTQNYVATFTDSSFSERVFQFIPASGAGLQFPVLTSGWSKSAEETYFNNLVARISDNQPITLELSNIVYNPLGDSAFYSATYFLNIPLEELGETKQYQGELHFTMIRDTRLLWSVVRWEDLKTSDEPTWSELKGLYY